MKKFRNEGMSAALFAVSILVYSCGTKETENRMSDDEKQIRTERTRSNKAIEDKDTITLASIWTEDYHIITSRNAEASGRDASRNRFASEFKTKPDVIYIRTPEKIEVFPQWNMAAENGQWVGRWTDEKGAHVEVSGTYYAKWHRIKRTWMIRAEIFVPLKCSGGGVCDEPPF